jgi:hypothetical protein
VNSEMNFIRFGFIYYFTLIFFSCVVYALNQSDLEYRFDKNRESLQSISQNTDQALLGLENANSAYLPRITLAQSLQSPAFQTPSLQVSIAASWNLLDAKRALQSRLAELQMQFATLEKTLEKSDALLNLRQYVQALNTYELGIGLLRNLEADVKKQRPLWTVETPAKQFAPNEIDSYLKFLEFVDTRKSLELQAERLRKQLSKWTKLPMSELSEGKIQFPGDPVLAGAVVVSTCVDQSPNMLRAKLRLEQEKVFEALRNDASPTLTVSGQLAATTAPVSGQSGFSGQISLTLNIPIPPNAPVSGNAQATVSNSGASQSASLSFPNAFRQSDPQGVYWATKNLEDTKEATQDGLEEALRSRDGLVSNVLLAKQRLEWGERSLRDSAGTDALVRLNARFALMGLKIRGAYDHLNLQLNSLTLANTCNLRFSYNPRDAVFGVKP